MKKIISLFIAVMLIFSIITPIYASNEEIQEKINNIKKSESKVAMFVSGDDEYLKIIERIIMLEVEKRNVL